jgi:3-dehydrosphinganine reductase
MRDFTGKNALITGGASGIGLAAAKELVRRKANVLIFDLNSDGLNRAVKELKTIAEEMKADVTCEGEAGDVTDFSSIRKVVEGMEKRGTPVDLLITSAGIAHPGALHELDVDIIKRTIDIDLLGTLYSCRAVLPVMVRSGRNGHIALISSVAGLLGVYGYSAYGAAKFGVRGLGEVLYQELKPYNINVTVLFPPDTDTPQLAYENQFKPEATKAISGTIKPVKAEYVARCLVNGIRKNRFLVVPTFTGKLTAVVSKIFTPFLRRYCTHVATKVVNKNKS